MPNIDWARIKHGFDFEKKHGESIGRTLVTVSLLSTYASKDTVPVVIFTKQLVNNYDRRMDKTGEIVQAMQAFPKSKEQFLAVNCKRAFELGQLHVDVASGITPADLGWDPKVRVPINQEAFALVFYTFALEPIETMAAMHEVDLKKDSKEIEDYTYLWKVLGYSMGMDLNLLPRNLTDSKRIMAAIREHQYFPPSSTVQKDVAALVRNHMQYVYKAFGRGKPMDDAAKEQVNGLVGLAIASSPKLGPALGLSNDPIKGLNSFLASPAP